jgi:hypothetical protein
MSCTVDAHVIHTPTLACIGIYVWANADRASRDIQGPERNGRRSGSNVLGRSVSIRAAAHEFGSPVLLDPLVDDVSAALQGYCALA